MNYYDEKQYLAAVSKDDEITGRIEKWEAHKKNILHRGYTVIIRYGDELVLQHRKHPVFNNVLDLSFSSHQTYIGEQLQTDEEAIYEGLRREWSMEKTDLMAPLRFLKKIYYQAADTKSGFFEHEIDYIYEARSLILPAAKPEFAFGAHLVKQSDIKQAPTTLNTPFAPWVATMLKEYVI